MSFKPGQIVQTTRSVKFGNSSKIPKSVRGTVLSVKGVLSKKCEVEFMHNEYGRVVITAPVDNFRGVYSF